MKNVEEYFSLIKTYKLLANKSLGQNFLVNPETAKSIVDLLEVSDSDKVLEIGAGLGSLSYFLVEKGDVELIDIDERMLNFLNEHFSDKKNIKIRRQNILKEDLSSYAKIIGNLPYYITSGIIEHILLNATNARKIVLMTQKEVYPKLLSNFASPISLLLNHVCKISSPINVNRNNFTPVPHVDSVVFSLTPNENIKSEDNKLLYKLISKLFLYRRKTILNCLTSVIGDKDEAANALKELCVSNDARAEQLDIDFYIRLLNLLKSKGLASKIV